MAAWTAENSREWLAAVQGVVLDDARLADAQAAALAFTRLVYDQADILPFEQEPGHYDVLFAKLAARAP